MFICSWPFVDAIFGKKYVISSFLFGFPVFVLHYNIVRDQMKLITHKSISITYSECVSVVLVIRHHKAFAPYYIFICGLSKICQKRHDFREKLLNVKLPFWFSLQLLSETFLILRRTERDITSVHSSSCKVCVILVRFQCNLNFRGRFSKNTGISNFMKVLWEPSCSMRTDGQIWRN